MHSYHHHKFPVGFSNMIEVYLSFVALHLEWENTYFLSLYLDCSILAYDFRYILVNAGKSIEHTRKP